MCKSGRNLIYLLLFVLMGAFVTWNIGLYIHKTYIVFASGVLIVFVLTQFILLVKEM